MDKVRRAPVFKLLPKMPRVDQRYLFPSLNPVFLGACSLFTHTCSLFQTTALPQPASIVLHLDASTLATAGSLSVWPDISGSGFNATQATGSLQPQVIPQNRFCSSVARFKGTYLTIPNQAALNPYSGVRLHFPPSLPIHLDLCLHVFITGLFLGHPLPRGFQQRSQRDREKRHVLRGLARGAGRRRRWPLHCGILHVRCSTLFVPRLTCPACRAMPFVNFHEVQRRSLVFFRVCFACSLVSCSRYLDLEVQSCP